MNQMNQKLLFTILLAISIVLITSLTTKACEIEFEITKGKKESYKTSDTLVLKFHIAVKAVSQIEDAKTNE